MTLQEWFRSQEFPSDESNLAVEASAFIKKGGCRSLKAGGQWIYDNEIDRIEYSSHGAEGLGSKSHGAAGDGAEDHGPENHGSTVYGSESYEAENEAIRGDIIKVYDFDGFFLGYGFYNPRSKISIRILARHEKDGIRRGFLKRRLKDAWELRKAVTDISSCRLVFGEADFLPGLTIDKFEDILVVESLALGIDRLKIMLLNDLAEILKQDGIIIRGIYERSDAKVRELEGMPRIKGFIGPEFDTRLLIKENGIKYIVDVKDGQKTGFFLDQKENRAAAARIAARKPGMRVLDCFTHTGSFGLNMAAAGASEVLSVDASDTAIEQAKENALLNGLDKIVSYRCADVFELLPELEKEGRKYDFVILDPPAFTKSRAATKNAIKGYREINIRGMKLVENGGYLATCSCSHFMSQELFKMTIEQAARGARKRLRQIEFRTQGPDHPYLWGDEESYYLKFYIFQVLEEK